MALQPRFGQGLSEKIPLLYSISSEVRLVTSPTSRVIAVHAIHPPGFRSWFRLPSSTALNRPICVFGLQHLLSCAQRCAIFCSSRPQWHLGCWTPYLVRNFTCSCTHRLLFLGDICIVRRTFLSKTNNRFSILKKIVFRIATIP
jgi:hypothetical protein